MWINQHLDSSQKYIFPEKDICPISKNITNWAKKNPNCQINLWFDSKFTTKDAVSQTSKLLTEKIKRYKKHLPIKFLDLRDLKLVQANWAVFESEIPIYFRIDLARVIMIENALENDHNNYLVYSDLDIKPKNKKLLFNKDTLQKIDQFGFVLAKSNNKAGFENGFQIFKYQPNLVLALNKVLIEESVAIAKNFLKNMKKGQELLLQKARLQETVFELYPKMFDYFYELESKSCKNPKKPAFPTKYIKMPTSTSQNFELRN